MVSNMRMKILKTKSAKTLKNYILIVTLVFFGVVFVYSDIIFTFTKSSQEIIKDFREKQFESIMLYFEELEEEASKNALKVSRSIEDDIKEFFDLDDLKTTMDEGRIPHKVFDILENNTKNIHLNDIKTCRNGILILNNSGVLIDHNYERASIKRADRTYESGRNSSWNKGLYDNAIKKILNKTGKDSIIAIEVFEPENKEHEKIPNPSYHNLEKIYVEEGIDALAGYQFLVPAYITETGDIFGQKDIERGLIQKNHKFIVVQEFNLYDQIQAYHKEFLDTVNEDGILSQHQFVLNVLYILGCFLLLSYLIVVVIFTNSYNYLLLKSEVANGNDEDKKKMS